MRRNFLLLTLCLLGLECAAQNPSEIKLDELRTPSAPGFSILGVQPAEIARPKSWRSLETTLANSFFNGDRLIVPQNIAIEFNPFFSTKKLNPQSSPAYIFGMAKKQMGFNLRVNSAFSVATGMFPNYYDTSFSNSRMGLGYRTQLISMKPTPAGMRAYALFMGKATTISFASFVLDKYKDEALEKKFADSTLLAGYKRAIIASMSNQTGIEATLDTLFLFEYIDQFVAAEIEQMVTANKSDTAILDTLEVRILNIDKDAAYRQNCNDVKVAIQERYGAAWEIATAVLVDFPSNDIYFSKVPKFGFWTTYTYRSENQHWEFGGMLRFISSKFDTSLRYNNIDFGARIMLGGEKWNINGEAIQRVQWEVVDNRSVGSGQNEVTFRYKLDFKAALTVNYKLTDDLILNYTFGNNLKVNTEFEKQPNLMSVVGIAYSFGGPKLKDIQ